MLAFLDAEIVRRGEQIGYKVFVNGSALMAERAPDHNAPYVAFAQNATTCFYMKGFAGTTT